MKIARTALVAVACAVGVFALYYKLPLGVDEDGSVWWSVAVIAILFSAALAFEIQAVVRHDEPLRRAVVSLAILLPLFIVLYAWLYLTLSVADPETFGHVLTRTESLYLTLTILSTVGFGDITPKTDVGRVAVMAQMVANVALLAFGVRLIIHFGSRAAKRQR